MIHDNYGRPFKVQVSNCTAVVSRPANGLDFETGREASTELFVLPYQRVFVGKSPKSPMTTFSGGHGSAFDGNSVLVNTSGLHYIMIGPEIYSFTALAPITTFVSEVGNNDVPYPWATDASGNVYLLIFGHQTILSDHPRDDEAPYDAYFRAVRTGESKGTKLPHQIMAGRP